jgi:hypothetical protein
MIYQAIELETPFVLYCPDCAKKHENISEENEELELNSEELY